MPDFKDGCPCQSVAHDDFTLVSPLGGLFKYYTSDGKYFREALNGQAHWTQEEDTIRICKTVYDLAYRTAQKIEEKIEAGTCATCMSYACVCDD